MKKILFFCLLAITAQAQLKLGNNIGTINANSVLELEHTTKGMLLPRVSLTSTTSYSPLSATIVAGFLIYNTNAAVSAGSSSYPINSGGTGLYYWDGSGWVAVKVVDALSKANNLSDLSNAATARSNLGLGTLATQSGTFSGTSSGTNTGDQTITLTGDVTGSGTGSFATSIAANAVTLADMAQVATATILGRSTAGTGNVEALSASSARGVLGATTVGANLFTLTNPSAITFPRFNANNTVSALGAASFRSAIGAGTSSTTGTVTSVGGTGTVSGLSLSGTVTTTGNLTLGGTLAVTPSNFASQTANTVLAAPNGIAGVPTFRTLVAADIPTLNQNTTGTASNVTGTVAVANGGTGATTAANARTNLGATTVGANLLTLTNPTAVTFPRFNADNTVSTLDAATFRSAIGAGTGSGTVTSVSGTGTVSGLSLSGTVTTTGNLTLGGTLSVTQSNLNLTGDITINSVKAGRGAVSTGTRFGENALASGSLSGNYNTAIGNGALRYLTTGSNNVGIGFQTLNSGSFTGSDNMAIGTTSLLSCTSGYDNTAIGTSALPNLTTALGNVAIGKYAGYNISTGAAYNTFIGHSAGGGITTGNYNTIIGASIGGLSSSLSNWIIIGDGAGNRRINVDASGRVGIGTNTPSTSAILELSTTAYGFIPPRMTSTQRGSLTVVQGLTIFCTDCAANDTSTGVMQTYNGSTWKNYW